MRTRVSRGLRSRKCRASARPKRLRLADRFARRQRVDRVLHRVGRQHVAVVAVGVRLVVVALEPDRDGQVAQVVAIAAARAPGRAGLATCRRPIERACRTPKKGRAAKWAADHSTPAFTALADLASARVGGRAIAANDDFFAPKVEPGQAGAADLHPGKFTARGKWMDGWESRRRRTPGHDWCVVGLGMRGVVRGVDVDTSFFTGNYPSHCSIDALDTDRAVTPALAAREGAPVDHAPAEVAAARRQPQLLRHRRDDGRAVDAPAAQHLSRRRRRPAARLRRGRRRLERASRARRPRHRSRVDRERRPGARRERHALRRQGQHDHARPREEHGRRLGDAAPARPRLRLGDRPARRAGRDLARRDRHQSLQGQLSRQRLDRGVLRARRDARRAARRARGSSCCRRRSCRRITGTSSRASCSRRGRCRTCGSTSFPTAASAGCASMEPWQRLDLAAPDEARDAAATLLRRVRAGSSACWRAARSAAREALLAAARDEWFALDADDWREAFAHHPKIGDRDSLRQRFARDARICRSANRRASTARPRTILDALAEGNRDYERKFGYIFIVCATGKSADEMLRAAPQPPAESARCRDPDCGGGAGEDHGTAAEEAVSRLSPGSKDPGATTSS